MSVAQLCPQPEKSSSHLALAGSPQLQKPMGNDTTDKLDILTGYHGPRPYAVAINNIEDIWGNGPAVGHTLGINNPLDYIEVEALWKLVVEECDSTCNFDSDDVFTEQQALPDRDGRPTAKPRERRHGSVSQPKDATVPNVSQ